MSGAPRILRSAHLLAKRPGAAAWDAGTRGTQDARAGDAGAGGRGDAKGGRTRRSDPLKPRRAQIT